MIEEALGGSATSFKVALAEALDLLSAVTVGEVDASNITSGIDSAVQAADTDVQVEAITADVTQQINDAVAAADPVVTPSVDTGPAEQQLSDFSASVGESGAGLEGLSHGLEGVAGLSEAAGGNVEGLVASLGSVTPAGAKAAGALIAVSAGIGESVKLALEATQAEARFARSLGEVAERVEAVHVDGFAKDLEELATNTGSSVAGLKNTLAGVADLGKSVGASGDDIANAAEDISLLGARAAVTNPALGDAGEAAQQLFRALISGRASALAPFGIALDQTAVQAEIVRQGLQGTITDLDPFTRAFIRAQVAVQSAGESLGKDITAGAQTPAIQLRRLRQEFEEALVSFGKPLLEPLVEAAKEGQPILLDLGKSFGELGGTALPLVVSGLQAAQPLVSLAADTFGLLNAVVGPLADGIADLPQPIVATAEALLLLKASGLGGGLAFAAQTFLPNLAAGVAGVTSALVPFIAGIAVGDAALEGMSAHSNKASSDISKIEAALKQGGDGLKEFDHQVREATSDGSRGWLDFAGAFGRATGIIDNKTEATEKAFRNLATVDPIGASTLLDSMRAAGRDVSKLEAILAEVGPAAAGSTPGVDALSGSLNALTGQALLVDQALGQAFGNVNSLVSAQRAQVDADRAVRDAEEAVAEARKGTGDATKSATDRVLELRQAELGLAQARSGLIDANDAVADAQQKLNDLYALSNEELAAIEDAQRSVEQAQRAYRDATDRVTEAQQRLLDVTRAATAAEADKARRDRSRAELSEQDALDRLEDAQKRADAANAALARAQGRSQKVQDAAAEQASDANRELAKAQLDVADATDRKKQAAKDAADVLDGSVGSAKEQADAQKQLDDAMQAQDDAAVALKKSQDELAKANDVTTVSAKDLHDATRELERAELAQQAAALQVDTAERGVQKAHEGTSGTAGKLRGAYEQLEAAQLRQVQANIDLQTALANTDGSQVTSREQIEASIKEWDRLASTLAPGSPLQIFAQQTADKFRTLLTNIPMDVDTDPARQSINDLLRDLNKTLFAGAPVFPTGPLLPPANAHAASGITDFSGGFLTVGERGKETLFISNKQSATVIPNSQTEQFAAGMNRPIEVNVFEVAQDPQATAFAVGARLGALSQR